MNVYVKTNSENRIVAFATPPFHCGDGEIEVTAPDEFTADNFQDYVLVDGHLVYDPLPVVEEPIVPTLDERLASLEEENAYLKEALDLLLSGATEEV